MCKAPLSFRADIESFQLLYFGPEVTEERDFIIQQLVNFWPFLCLRILHVGVLICAVRNRGSVSESVFLIEVCRGQQALFTALWLSSDLQDSVLVSVTKQKTCNYFSIFLFNLILLSVHHFTWEYSHKSLWHYLSVCMAEFQAFCSLQGKLNTESFFMLFLWNMFF